MRDLGIAERLRIAGLNVVEVAGWQSRGDDFHPQVGVMHHTGAGGSQVLPSLGALIAGKPGVPGPLCNVAQSRDPWQNDAFYVIASGKSNNAGEGGWHGFSGNSNTWGLEIEHNGLTPLLQTRQVLAARALAAIIGGLSADRVCQHREWAPTRKIDAATNVDPTRIRAMVADFQHGPSPAWPFSGDEYMPKPSDVTGVLETDVGAWQMTADGGILTMRGPFYGSYPGLPPEARQGTRYFTAITANRGRPGYTLWANDRAHYSFPA